MRIAVAGGGPGGLFFATLMRRADPSVSVTVFERNRADDTFGFGVVFSDRTLDAINAADPVLREALTTRGRHWDEIEVRLKGERLRCGGNGMASVVRRTLLRLLQDRAAQAGAELRFATPVTLADLRGYDLVVAADGTGSRIRDELLRARAELGLADLGMEVDTATAKFIWFGTDYLFDGLTFVHERGADGAFAVHGYPISDEVSTFIVETDEQSWRKAGLDAFDVTRPPGASDLISKKYLEQLFAEQIDGRQLLVNNSRWGNFRTRRTRHWHALEPHPVVFIGDAVHTAHFSVGSGTKMAMEDAIALSAALAGQPGDLAAALAAYEAAAQPSVRRIQDSARPSLAWWEHFGRYYDAFEPWQFAYHFLTRSMTDGRLARRAPQFAATSHRGWAVSHGGGKHGGGEHGGAEPLGTPFSHGGWSAPGRVVAVALATDGTPALVTGGALPLPLLEPPGPPGPGAAGPWGAALAAPQTEAGLPPAFAALAGLAALDNPPVLVALHGGTPLTRVLLSEQARMQEQLPSLVVAGESADEAAFRDEALTAVLSGRADLVGRPAPPPGGPAPSAGSTA